MEREMASINNVLGIPPELNKSSSPKEARKAGSGIGKEAKARLQIIMDDKSKADAIGFHKFVFGHYHTFFETDLYSCCPSVSGTDAYDHKSGRHSDPGQSAWIVHPKLKEINFNNFRL